MILARRAQHLSGPLHPDAANIISFDSGFAFPQIFPDLTQAATRALSDYRSEALQYGKPFGLLALREWIARYMHDDGAESVTADDILIVNGAKNGLDLLCRLLTEEGDAIVVTGPTYFTAIPIFRSFGLRFIEVPQDAGGMDVALLAERLAERTRAGLPPPKFIYDVPDFHNPSGITMSRARREALLALAKDTGIAIIEDSPYRKLRYDGETIPSLKALDRNGIVFALGTFSKLLAPGLRLGWISADHELLARVAQLKSDGGTSPMAQRVVLEFLKDGELSAHLEHARAAYAEHRNVMVAALRRELPEAQFAVPQGGYYLWLRFPDGVTTSELADRAFAGGVSIIPGSAFFAADDTHSARHRGTPNHFVRLAYSFSTPPEIDAGVKILARAYYSMT
jgi:2-aminoadipate transaminase